MSSKQKKRPRAPVDEKPADCPFQVTTTPAPTAGGEKDTKGGKRRRGDGPGGQEKRLFFQIAPFEPAGNFRSRETMDIHYVVEPRARWMEMTKYNSFVLNGKKYLSDEFIFVANDEAIERQKSGQIPNQQVGPGDFWVARILEIRASDEHHVYARVFWMYSPDELPAATMSGKKTVAGRQAYHGMNELIASNHMDIINVVSVVQGAKVNQWIEADDDEIQDALYWRQAFECQTNQLSPIDLICRCQTPANPDKTQVGCTYSDCGKWMHIDCLRDDVLERVYNRLGTDRPHIVKEPPVKKEPTIKKESAQEPLSPPKGDDEQTRATIAVHGDANTDDAAVQPSIENSTDQALQAAQLDLPERPKGLVRKKSVKGRATNAKPWVDLFDADLRMSDDGPMVWNIEDKRPGVTGGSKTWTERAICLLCGNKIE